MSKSVEAVRRYTRNPGVIWIFLGTGARALGQLLLMWLLLRVDGPEGVGAYGIAVAWTVPITVFASLELVRVQATDFNETFSIREYLSLRYVSSGFAFLVIVGEAIFIGGSASSAIFGLGTMLVVASIIEIFQGRLLQIGDTVSYGKSTTIINSSLWSVSAIAVFVTHSIAAAFIIGSIVAILLLKIHLLPILSRIEEQKSPNWLIPHFESFRLLPLFRLSFPLGLGLFFDSLATQVPRFFLQATEGVYELGIFVGLLAFLSVGVLMIEALAQSVTPGITRLVQRQNGTELDRFLGQTITAILLLLVVVVVAAYTLGSRFAGIVLEDVYGEYPVAVAAIGVVFGLQLSQRLFSIAITAARLTDQLLYVNIAALAVGVLAGWMFIPRFGVDGAAFTMVTLNVMRAVIMAFLVKRSTAVLRASESQRIGY